MIEILFWLVGICFVFGVVYPVCAILIYPFYRLFGGEEKFLDYMRSL